MVSVIIPVYNGEKYINIIIDCFEKQKYKDFELIFINDGSRDNSLDEIKKEKTSSCLKIKIVDQKNAGVSAARNAGIRNSEGDFICFCDVDDEVTENYLSVMHSTIVKNNVDLVICKHKLVKISKSDEVEDVSRLKIETGKIVLKSSDSVLKDFLYGRVVSGCCTIMVKKSVLSSSSLWFAEGYKYSEDLHMLWRIIACSKKIAYIDNKLYLYKLQDDSATSIFNENRMHGYQLMKELEEFFEEINPKFSAEYKKFGAAKIMWSITWQAAIKLDEEDFRIFMDKFMVKNEMRKLITFKKFKVALSSVLFCFSPFLFRKVAKKFGKKYIH